MVGQELRTTGLRAEHLGPLIEKVQFSFNYYRYFLFYFFLMPSFSVSLGDRVWLSTHPLSIPSSEFQCVIYCGSVEKKGKMQPSFIKFLC